MEEEVKMVDIVEDTLRADSKYIIIGCVELIPHTRVLHAPTKQRAIKMLLPLTFAWEVATGASHTDEKNGWIIRKMRLASQIQGVVIIQ
eukprot:10011413-Ditylum_brightwellii.AAC.1